MICCRVVFFTKVINIFEKELKVLKFNCLKKLRLEFHSFSFSFASLVHFINIIIELMR